MSRCARVLSRRRFSNSPRSILRNSPGFPVPALDTTRPMSRSLVASASLSRKPSCDRSATTVRYCTLKSFARPCPTSSSKLSCRATSTTLSPEAASCRANSLPIPDEAPVTSAHGPNRFLSIWVFMCVFSSCDSRPDPPHGRTIGRKPLRDCRSDSPCRPGYECNLFLKAIHFLLLKLVTPHLHSQTAHPIFKPLRFHRHQLRITRPVSQDRYSLQ